MKTSTHFDIDNFDLDALNDNDHDFETQNDDLLFEQLEHVAFEDTDFYVQDDAEEEDNFDGVF
ncbi:hypothetical protein PZB74_14090 [Porifericola rhodea]|uniref:hypothetical protein n=1 Tax=Porifericola rhodea TaxID=930972 RepID=UPI002666A0E6|nr:hypothetical protein [Porifericola rhodea]WKN30091.1 hypothetical protein PZB74_14090 [Porifericola rhodea]